MRIDLIQVWFATDVLLDAAVTSQWCSGRLQRVALRGNQSWRWRPGWSWRIRLKWEALGSHAWSSFKFSARICSSYPFIFPQAHKTSSTRNCSAYQRVFEHEQTTRIYLYNKRHVPQLLAGVTIIYRCNRPATRSCTLHLRR
jgi:hypothetical protein